MVLRKGTKLHKLQKQLVKLGKKVKPTDIQEAVVPGGGARKRQWDDGDDDLVAADSEEDEEDDDSGSGKKGKKIRGDNVAVQRVEKERLGGSVGELGGAPSYVCRKCQQDLPPEKFNKKRLNGVRRGWVRLDELACKDCNLETPPPLPCVGGGPLSRAKAKGV